MATTRPKEGADAAGKLGFYALRSKNFGLGGEAFGDERLVRRRVRDIRRRCSSFFLDLGEQPGLGGGGRPLLLRVIAGEAAGLEDDGAQLGGAAATGVVEVRKRKAGPRHRILQEGDRRRSRQPML